MCRSRQIKNKSALLQKKPYLEKYSHELKVLVSLLIHLVNRRFAEVADYG